MNLIGYFIASFLCLCSVARAEIFDAQEKYLDNGLRVIISENHKAPIAKTMLFYKVGSMDEVGGKTGLAHLLEHLMFRGTTEVPNSKFNDYMHENGIEYNAFTSADFTAYHALTDISRLELVLALEADRMVNLNITDDAFSGEQKIVFEERQQRTDNSSKALFAEEVNQILWQKTPYEHPVSGFAADIKALTKNDALGFYKHFYAPDNAVLIIVGDIEPMLGFELVEKYFGNIRKKSELNQLKQDAFASLEKGGAYVASKELDDVQTKLVILRYITPSILTDEKAAFALSVFSSYFGESENSYLKRHLVEPQKVIDASSSHTMYGRGPGTFSIAVLPFKEDGFNSEDQLKKILTQALNDFDGHALEKEKKKMLSWFVYVKNNPEDAASLLGSMAALGLTLNDIEQYKANIENVTLDDVKKAVLTMIEKSKHIIAVSEPKKE